MPRGGSNNWGPSLHRGPYQGDTPKGCWLWTGRTVGRMGYGKATVGGRDARVHRAVFRAVYGWDPPVVRHRCDEPLCWRPDHLLAGTTQENVNDRVERGRQQRGEACYNAVIDEDRVRKIRAMKGQGMTIRAIAEAQGLTWGLVQAVASGRAWRHVQPTTDSPDKEAAA